jgi:hypothetical protein
MERAAVSRHPPRCGGRNVFASPVAYVYKVIEPVMRPTQVQEAPRRKIVASAQPVSLVTDACSALPGVAFRG